VALARHPHRLATARQRSRLDLLRHRAWRRSGGCSIGVRHLRPGPSWLAAGPRLGWVACPLGLVCGPWADVDVPVAAVPDRPPSFAPLAAGRLGGRATTIVIGLTAAVAPIPLDDGLPVNPLGIERLAGVWEVVEPIGSLLLAALTVASATSLVVRFRRARGEERQQLKWFTYGAGILTVLLAVSALLPALDTRIPSLVVAAALAAPPLAIGVAILRYRLYDIDQLINRTLVYGLLTALLGVVYAAVVLVLGQQFGGIGAEPPSWAVAGATLAVAALFQPARRRIQGVVDRRFNRRRYNAAKTVEAFSARLRDEVDLDALATELLAVAHQTMQPTSASLWLRPSAPARPRGQGLGS
jgi:hypothetical protein